MRLSGRTGFFLLGLFVKGFKVVKVFKVVKDFFRIFGYALDTPARECLNRFGRISPPHRRGI